MVPYQCACGCYNYLGRYPVEGVPSYRNIHWHRPQAVREIVNEARSRFRDMPLSTPRLGLPENSHYLRNNYILDFLFIGSQSDIVCATESPLGQTDVTTAPNCYSFNRIYPKKVHTDVSVFYQYFMESYSPRCNGLSSYPGHRSRQQIGFV